MGQRMMAPRETLCINAAREASLITGVSVVDEDGGF